MTVPAPALRHAKSESRRASGYAKWIFVSKRRPSLRTVLDSDREFSEE
jgi:hypothetical protein